MSERPTQAEIDEANSTHAQEVGEHCNGTGNELANSACQGFVTCSECGGKSAQEVEEQEYSTTSDRYRADLYDEVWNKARSMGFANVTDALATIAQQKEEIERLKEREDKLACAMRVELSQKDEELTEARQSLGKSESMRWNEQAELSATQAREARLATVLKKVFSASVVDGNDLFSPSLMNDMDDALSNSTEHTAKWLAEVKARTLEDLAGNFSDALVRDFILGLVNELRSGK